MKKTCNICQKTVEVRFLGISADKSSNLLFRLYEGTCKHIIREVEKNPKFYRNRKRYGK